MPRFSRAHTRHDAALVASYLRQLRDASRPPQAQKVSGTIRIAPAGHSATQIPQPLQKSRSTS